MGDGIRGARVLTRRKGGDAMNVRTGLSAGAGVILLPNG